MTIIHEEDTLLPILLVLPPGANGSFDIHADQWYENGYTTEYIGEYIRDRAMELRQKIALEITTNQATRVITIKWYEIGDEQFVRNTETPRWRTR